MVFIDQSPSNCIIPLHDYYNKAIVSELLVKLLYMYQPILIIQFRTVRMLVKRFSFIFFAFFLLNVQSNHKSQGLHDPLDTTNNGMYTNYMLYRQLLQGLCKFYKTVVGTTKSMRRNYDLDGQSEEMKNQINNIAKVLSISENERKAAQDNIQMDSSLSQKQKDSLWTFQATAQTEKVHAKAVFYSFAGRTSLPTDANLQKIKKNKK